MKNITVKYIPADATEEKSLELKNVTRVQESLNQFSLHVYIDDTDRVNKTEDLNELINGTIVAFHLNDEENTVITKYNKVMGNTFRVFYASDSENDNIIRINFIK